MNTTETKLKYEICSVNPNALPVIIVAAGSSARMNGINKQFLEINSIPVIIKTMLAFEQSTDIKNIILVTKAEDIFKLQLLAEKHNISKLTDIVCGGNSRQESVLKGLARVGTEDEAVLIHDGARPLVSNQVINRVVSGLKSYSAVTCAVKVKDTVKQIDADGKVIKTLDRSSLVAVQTPQGVKVKEYRQAVDSVKNLADFTDDTSIMEAAGFEILTVEGDYKNIKITTPEDIATAQKFAESEE